MTNYVDINGAQILYNDLRHRTASADANLAAQYDSTQVYSPGEYCIYQDDLYRCIAPITTAEAWTAAHWLAVNVSEELAAIAAYEKIEIKTLSVSPSVAEVGSAVASVSLPYTLNKAASSIQLDGSAIPNTAASDTITKSGSWTGAAPQDSTTFSLTATDERNFTAPAKTASLTFQNRVYYGAASAPETLDSTFVAGLSNKVFDGNTRKRTVSVNAGSGKYIYYAVPTRLGTCTFTVGGFTGGFSLAGTIQVTNESGYSENYYVYKSDNANLGSTSVAVT